MMAKFKLFGNLHSGHSYKIRQQLLLADIPHEYQAVDIFLPVQSRNAEWRSLATFGEVPVLLGNGKAYVQSNAILLHLVRSLRGHMHWRRSKAGCSGKPIALAGRYPITVS
jgi:glutathione S-transferase